MALSGSEHQDPCSALTTYLQQAQTGVWDVRASFLPAIYFEGVDAGRRHRRCCCRRNRSTTTSPSGCSTVWTALIITGGRDVDPDRYAPGAASEHRRAGAATATRGSSRCCAARWRGGMPVLGICRGAQVLNVALGGTLHQHLPDVVGPHRHQRGNAVFTTSTVRTVPGTRLAGADRRVVRRAVLSPPGDRPTRRRPDRQRAATRDGVIEAVEIPG